MTAVLDVERRVVRAAFRPPPRMTVSEWADAYRYLSSEASAEVGKYSSARAPYQREPMDAMSDPRVRRVVLMWGSQIGKTEIINNTVGHRIHLQPGPMLVMQPTLDMAETWSKDRLATMIRDTPVLSGTVRDPRARDSGNTILHKSFAGGHVTVVGANSPASLASRPIRDVFCDEVDRYNASAGAEGDPVDLAFRRSSTFSNRKLVLISSPTIKGISRIEKAYADSSQARWHVECPHCHALGVLRLGGRDLSYGLKWDAGNPATTAYLCESCAVLIEEMHKGWMNERGRWIHEVPEHPTRGYWLNALVSPWVKWADVVTEFLEVKSVPDRLRQFVNTVLCETWEDEGAKVEAHVLADRYEVYAADVPDGVAVLTRAVDVQGDRIETAVFGWGAGEECWPIAHDLIPGDPGTQAPWKELAAILLRTYTHQGGAQLRPLVTFIDSGGHHSKEVYAFAKEHAGQRVFAIKGSSLEGAPLLGRPTRTNAMRTVLYPIGSFTGKESILARLAKIAEPGPGYVHIGEWMDGEHLNQLTAEKLVTKFVGGRPKRTWVKESGRRNEMLDLIVYALAALQQLGPSTIKQLGALADALRSKNDGEPDPADAVPTPSQSSRRPNTWLNSWRR